MAGPILSVLGGLAGLAVTAKGVEEIAKGLDDEDYDEDDYDDEDYDE